MLYTLPIQIWSAMSVGIFGGIFVKLMTRTMAYSGDKYPQLVDDTDKQNEYALIAMALLGVGEILGGQIIGFIRDRRGNFTAYAVETVLLVAAVILVIVFNEENKFGPMAYIMIFMWGLHDSGIQCLIRSIMGFEFDS
jgi:predicted MFS family arabinose efflux permease